MHTLWLFQLFFLRFSASVQVDEKLTRQQLLRLNKLVSDLDIDTNLPDSWDCKEAKYSYPAAGRVITGNLKII